MTILAGFVVFTDSGVVALGYVALKNNVSTIEMELRCHRWKPGTEEFVPHHVLADYIQDTATDNAVQDCIRYNTRYS